MEKGIVIAAAIVLVVAVLSIVFWIGYVKGRDAERYKDTPRSLHMTNWPQPNIDVPMPEVKPPAARGLAPVPPGGAVNHENIK